MRILFLITLCFFISQISAQDFEGKIVYKNNYTSKVSAFTSEKLNLMAGTRQEYYLKNGNYKSVTDGTFSDWQLFINKDNKLYTHLINNDTIFWQDASIASDTIVNFKINKSVIKICGYTCDELILTGKKTIQKYYYSSALKINPRLYNKHKLNARYDYVKVTGSVPLKALFEAELFTVEHSAIEVKKMKLTNSDFQLPNGSITARSRYN